MKEKKYYLVYKVTNNVNDKIYIGVHKTDNTNDGYIGSGKVLKRAINKYGSEHFTKEVLYECKSQEEMFQREADIVDEEFIRRKDTYNIKLGGYGGFDYINKNYSHELRVKLGKISGPKSIKILAEKEKDPEYIKNRNKKISKGLKKAFKEGRHRTDTFTGKKHTEETKAKIGKKNSIHQSGKGNSQYGTCWIYSEVEKVSKKIKKEELEKWLEQGWNKGRKMKFN